MTENTEDALASASLLATSGSAVDSAAFYYKNDQLNSQGMTNVVYDEWQFDPSTPINVATATATATVSNQISQTQTMSISFSGSVSSTCTFSTTAGLKTTVQAGVPFVAKGEVEVSATVSLDVRLGASTTVNNTFGYSASLSVPAGQSVTATATADSYTLQGGYTATFAEVWAHAGAVTRQVTAYNATVAYETVCRASANDL